jgi:hypothetical protein
MTKYSNGTKPPSSDELTIEQMVDDWALQMGISREELLIKLADFKKQLEIIKDKKI